MLQLEKWAQAAGTWERTEEITVVVDGLGLAMEKVSEETLTPRQQLEILQRLVNIQQQEDWQIWVLFNGEALPQVEHGGDFMGLRVFFSPTPPQRIPTLLECVRVLGTEQRQTLLITDDEVLEARARSQGAFTLRALTLKKAYDRLFVRKSRPQSRLMRHRTQDRRRPESESRPRSIQDMVDLIDDEE